MSRLTIAITCQQHQRLKAPAWKELQALLASRIEDGLAGKVSPKSVDDIFDNELAKGGRI